MTEPHERLFQSNFTLVDDQATNFERYAFNSCVLYIQQQEQLGRVYSGPRWFIRPEHDGAIFHCYTTESGEYGKPTAYLYTNSPKEVKTFLDGLLDNSNWHLLHAPAENDPMVRNFHKHYVTSRKKNWVYTDITTYKKALHLDKYTPIPFLIYSNDVQQEDAKWQGYTLDITKTPFPQNPIPQLLMQYNLCESLRRPRLIYDVINRKVLAVLSKKGRI